MTDLSPQAVMGELGQCGDDAYGIQRFNQLVFGTPLHDGQLRVALGSRKQTNLISPGNSWGKTEFIAREAVRYCWLKLVHGDQFTSPREWLERDYRALVCSYQFDVAKESFHRLDQRNDQGGVLAQLVKRIVTKDPPKVEFMNGSVLDFGSLDQGGRHVEATRRQAIWVDEVGHIPDFRDIYRSILFPRTIGVRGIIWLLGTPKPSTDPWLYEVAMQGAEQDGYYSFYEASSYENTYWPEDERQRVEANPELFNRDGSLTPMGRQVVEGKFILAGGLFFSRPHILRMFRGTHEFYVPGLEVEPSGETYRTPHLAVTAWDVAGSKKTADATVGVTLDLDVRPWRVSRLEHLPGGSVDWAGKYDFIHQCWEEDESYAVGVDVTGPSADSISEELMNRGLPIEPIHFGGQTSKKYDMLRNLQSRMETGDDDLDGNPFRGWLRFPDVKTHPELEERKKEFDFYRLDDAKLITDTVMATAMAVKLASDLVLPDPMFGPSF
jgi:hypothetical protein